MNSKNRASLNQRGVVVLICIGLYFLSLLPRIVEISRAPIYGDEITWMVWSKELLYNIKSRNWTYLKEQVWWKDKTDVNAIGLPSTFLGGLSHVLFAGNGKYSLHLFDDITSVRLPSAVVQSTLVPIIFLTGTFLAGGQVGLISAITYAMYPISIGIDRWFIHDGSLALYSFSSIAVFIYFYKKQKNSIIPGLLLALSILVKPLGVLPLIAWAALVFIDRSYWGLKLLLLNCISAFLFINIIWPGSWMEPALGVFRYLIYSLGGANLKISNYYLGGVTFDPGWSYYLFQLFTRMPEIIVLFSISASLYVFSKEKSSILKAIFLYCLIFFFVISAVPIKLTVRYALPIIPWIYLGSAYYLVEILKKVPGRWSKTTIGLFYILLASTGVNLHPHYFLYYNQFIGGPGKAQDVDMVAPCYGSKAAMEYIDTNNLKGLVSILGCQGPEKYYPSGNISISTNHVISDYVIVEATTLQKSPTLVREYTKHRKLIEDIYEGGVNTAKIYR